MNIASLSTLSSKSAVAALSLGILMSSVSVAQTIIVSESFGGLGTDDLNGTAADTFSTAIASAGGSSTWSAAVAYAADGSIDGNGAAFLDLGSYVNDAKGKTNGLFTLSMTLDEPVSPKSWVSYGFLVDGAGTGSNFTTVDSAATIIYRDGSQGVDGFAGLQTGGDVDGTTLADGTTSFNPSATGQLLTTVLDLTPDGGYDGSSNFGTVYFYGGDDSAGNLLGSAQISASMDFDKLALTTTGGGTGNVSSLSLSQVPEPSALLLSGLSLLALLRRRR